MSGARLGGQLLAALRTAARDDLAAVLGGHAQTEAVAAGAHKKARLKSALHGELQGLKICR